MMMLKLSFVALALLGAHVSADNDDNNNGGRTQVRCDVVVIGGGAGGANAAVFARDKGYGKVCILEKQSDLGGMCDTVPIDASRVPQACPYIPLFGGRCPTWDEFGVFVISNSSRLREYGWGDWKFDTNQHLARFVGANNVYGGTFGMLGQSARYIADLQHAIDLGPESLPTDPAQIAAFQAAVGGLFQSVFFENSWLDNPGDYPDPIPKQILVDFLNYSTTHGFGLLQMPILQELLGGLGQMDKLTAWYGLMIVNRLSLQTIDFVPGTQPTGMFIWGGCQKLYDAILPFIGADNVFFGVSQISSVTRKGNDDDGGNVRVQFTARNGQQFTLKAKKLIIAIPPTTDNMAFLDATKDEAALFAKVKLRYLATASVAANSPLLNGLQYANYSFSLTNADVTRPSYLPASPTILGISKTWPYGNIHVEYVAQSPQPTNVTIAAINNQLNFVPANYGFAGASFQFIKEHGQYQPYFSADDLATSPTPYTSFKAIQGKSNTIYVGATLTYSSHAAIMDHAYRNVMDHL